MIRPFSGLFASAALLTAASQAAAAAVVIWPVDPTISKDERSAALWVENQGPEPLSVQIRALSWRQTGGEETLVNQDEVVASPPIASVPPGGRQLVRLIRRNITQPVFEQSYRLLIDELPAPPQPGKDGTASASLSVQMRYSVPLFTYQGEATAEKAALRTKIIEGQQRFIEITNIGRKHARLVDLRAVDASGSKILQGGLVGYVLSGETMRWPLPAVASGALHVTVNGADYPLDIGG